jgi:glycosyltransferase involved in cell wall biosynthesis
VNSLTIVIPTYERPDFLAECLETVSAQTRKDFDLVVLDNASTREYGPVLERFSSLGIEYIRNERNIGSGGNQAKAREICTRSEFGMVFHDDDLMHPRLIEWELGIIEAHPDFAWVAAECLPFTDGSSPPVEVWQDLSGRAEIFGDRAALVRCILQAAPLHFGSVLFRTAALSAASPVEAYERLHIVADRPYLLDIAKAGGTALIREPLALYRLHAAQDTYDPHFTEDQAIALMHYYRDILPEQLGPEDERLFLRHSTNYLLHAHSFTRPGNHGSFRDAVKREQAEGLFRWRSIDGQGIAALANMAGLGRPFAVVRPALGAIKRAIRRDGDG